MYLGAVFEACYNEHAVCWKCTANDLNFSEFELSCSADMKTKHSLLGAKVPMGSLMNQLLPVSMMLDPEKRVSI